MYHNYTQQNHSKDLSPLHCAKQALSKIVGTEEKSNQVKDENSTDRLEKDEKSKNFFERTKEKLTRRDKQSKDCENDENPTENSENTTKRFFDKFKCKSAKSEKSEKSEDQEEYISPITLETLIDDDVRDVNGFPIEPSLRNTPNFKDPSAANVISPKDKEMQGYDPEAPDDVLDKEMNPYDHRSKHDDSGKDIYSVDYHQEYDTEGKNLHSTDHKDKYDLDNVLFLIEQRDKHNHLDKDKKNLLLMENHPHLGKENLSRMDRYSTIDQSFSESQFLNVNDHSETNDHLTKDFSNDLKEKPDHLDNSKENHETIDQSGNELQDMNVKDRKEKDSLENSDNEVKDRRDERKDDQRYWAREMNEKTKYLGELTNF